MAAARFGVLPMPTTRGEVTDGRQPVPTILGRVRAAARPHLSRGSCSDVFHGAEIAADLRDHGFLGEAPEPNAEAMLGLRVARADLLRHAYRDLPHTTSTVRHIGSGPAEARCLHGTHRSRM